LSSARRALPHNLARRSPIPRSRPRHSCGRKCGDALVKLGVCAGKFYTCNSCESRRANGGFSSNKAGTYWSNGLHHPLARSSHGRPVVEGATPNRLRDRLGDAGIDIYIPLSLMSLSPIICVRCFSATKSKSSPSIAEIFGTYNRGFSGRASASGWSRSISLNSARASRA